MVTAASRRAVVLRARRETIRASIPRLSEMPLLRVLNTLDAAGFAVREADASERRVRPSR
jgi:DNA-binding HxlR family transcriptional regulator